MEDQEILDIYGNAGWELTQIYTEPQCHYPVVKIKMYFKREINPYRFYQYYYYSVLFGRAFYLYMIIDTYNHLG